LAPMLAAYPRSKAGDPEFSLRKKSTRDKSRPDPIAHQPETAAILEETCLGKFVLVARRSCLQRNHGDLFRNVISPGPAAREKAFP
jgi:hypothetical protein